MPLALPRSSSPAARHRVGVFLCLAFLCLAGCAWRQPGDTAPFEFSSGFVSITNFSRFSVSETNGSRLYTSEVLRTPLAWRELVLSWNLDTPPDCAWLLDSHVDGALGGTGVAFDWDVAVEATKLHPQVILAGGLKVETVADAVRRVRPHGVDVSSGVEFAPGRKDANAVRRFIAAAKAA